MLSHRQQLDQSFANTNTNLMAAISTLMRAKELKDQNERQGRIDTQNTKATDLQIQNSQAELADRAGLSQAQTRLSGLDAGLPNQGMTGPLPAGGQGAEGFQFTAESPSPFVSSVDRAKQLDSGLKHKLVAEIRTRRGQPTTAEDVAQEFTAKEQERALKAQEAGLRSRQVGQGDRELELKNRSLDLEDKKLNIEANKVGKVDAGTALEQHKFARQLKQDFAGSQVTKDFQIIDRTQKQLHAVMDAAKQKIKDGKPVAWGAVDQPLITLFNKLLDPGSVVRESEYARTPENMAYLDALSAKWDKVKSGGAGLDNSFRDELLAVADTLVAASESGFAAHVKDAAFDAESYGIPIENVVGGYSRLLGEKPAAGSAAPAAASAGITKIGSEDDYNKLPAGAQYLDPKGVLRRKK
jgi:hypothetical protein